MARWTDLARDTWKRFGEHGDLLAAAISFYTLLSIAPLFVIALTVAGLVFDPRSVMRLLEAAGFYPTSGSSGVTCGSAPR